MTTSAFGYDPRFDSFYIRGFDVTYTGIYPGRSADRVAATLPFPRSNLTVWTARPSSEDRPRVFMA